jgi:acetyl-CoA carboxylase beta subunit
MAQITVRLSEAETGIKGGISVGTGRYNQESAVQVAIEMVERQGGSIGDAAMAAIIEQQNPGTPDTVEEALEEFEEAIEAGQGWYPDHI